MAFFGIVQRHEKGMPRAARTRGGKATKRGLSSEQTPVLICRDRAGSTADFVLKKIAKENLSAALKPLIAASAGKYFGTYQSKRSVMQSIYISE